MLKKDKKVILVTGASAGLGYRIAEKLLAEDCILYVGARSIEKMEKLKEAGAKVLFLDVTQDASVKEAVDRIISEEGRIDVLINNAGTAYYGTVEELPLEDARAMYELNFWGVIRMSRAVLPSMRARKCGRIVNISSGSGHYTDPLCGFYCATKYAIEAISDALRMECHKLGIKVSLITPGYFKSTLDDKIRKSIESAPFSKDYQFLKDGFDEVFPDMWEQGADLDTVADSVLEAVLSEEPKARYYPCPGVLGTMQRKWDSEEEEFDRWMMEAYHCEY